MARTIQTPEGDHSYQIVVVIVLSLVLTNLAVSLRLFSRKSMKLEYKADDYMIIVAAIFVTGDAIIYPFSIHFGSGKHLITLSRHEIEGYAKTKYASAQLFGLSITAVKISVLLFYRRVFSTAPFRRWIILLGILVLAWLLVNNFLGVFQCTPIRKAWNPEMPGHCIHYLMFFMAMQVPNILLDIVILTLPLRAISQLQMSRGRKISVAGAFLLGGFSIVIAIVRLAILVTRLDKTDITYSTAIGDWSLIEPAVEVVCACLPTMAPLLNVHQHWIKLRPSLGFRFRTSKATEEEESSHRFHKIQNVDALNGIGGTSGTITKIRAHDAPGDMELWSYGIPMDAIGVKKEIQCFESRQQT